MKSIHTLVLLSSIVVATGACEKDDTVASCVRFCRDKTEASVYNAEVHECSIPAGALSSYSSKCRNDCTEVMNIIVAPEYRSEAIDCLDCVHDEVKDEPTDAAIAKARDGVCFPVCKELGASQFFASFYVTAPEWDCPSE